MEANLLDETTLETLLMLADEDDPEFLRDTVLLFETDMMALLREIERSISDENLPELRASAHKAKGMCLNIGAKGLADVMLKIESAAKEGKRYNELKPLGISSVMLFRDTQQALASWVQNHPPFN
jgi:HPt (histidine-containing phosphotransfer) domain-containing protein